VIKLILVGLMALGISGPIDGLIVHGNPIALSEVRRNDPNAEIRGVISPKNAIVFDLTDDKNSQDFSRFHKHDGHLLTRIACDVAWHAWFASEVGEIWKRGKHFDTDDAIKGCGMSYVAARHNNIQEFRVNVLGNFEFQTDTGALLRFTQNVSPPRFIKSSPDKNDTNYAQYHADNGSSAHDVGPIGRLALSHKVLLVTLVSAAFLAIFCNAIRLFIADKPDAALPYLLVGVSGIFTSIGVGLPLIHGVP
jgi:hypothetical protein